MPASMPTRPGSTKINHATPQATQHGTLIVPLELEPKLMPLLLLIQTTPSTEHDAISDILCFTRAGLTHHIPNKRTLIFSCAWTTLSVKLN